MNFNPQIKCASCGFSNDPYTSECLECFETLTRSSVNLIESVIKKFELETSKCSLKLGYVNEFELVQACSIHETLDDYKQAPLDHKINILVDYLIKKRSTQLGLLEEYAKDEELGLNFEILLLRLCELNGDLDDLLVELQSNKLESIVNGLNKNNSSSLIDILIERSKNLSIDEHRILANIIYAELNSTDIIRNGSIDKLPKYIPLNKCIEFSLVWLGNKQQMNSVLKNKSLNEFIETIMTRKEEIINRINLVKCDFCNGLHATIFEFKYCKCKLCMDCFRSTYENIISRSNRTNIISNVKCFVCKKPDRIEQEINDHFKFIKEKFKEHLSEDHYAKYVKLMIEAKSLELAKLIEYL